MSVVEQQTPPVTTDINADLGFGSVVARESRRRLLNRDGTFNVRREGLGFWQSLSAYHYILTMSWARFIGVVGAVYITINTLFALGYVACGPDALAGFHGETPEMRFARAFFFSVETVATIGYGSIAPITIAANLLMTIESLVGLLGFSLVAGIVFARFARPTAQIIFSDVALIAPYRNITAFMFRIVNQRSNEIVEMEAKVLLSIRRRDGDVNDREFLTLKLERDRVAFFPLSWTIVHPIDSASPMFGLSPEALRERDGEFLILLNGFDETFSQTVHTRSSYKPDEVVCNARFKSILNIPNDDGLISVDIRKLHEVEML
ncbi:MAG: inward rectifier potassium channel [Acidobacteriota bacterium]|jgi:inward rectifier potassium channel|nr:inward rectifier potassium channel [Acidobacteriota bacterium]